MLHSSDLKVTEIPAEDFPRTVRLAESAVSELPGQGVTPGLVGGVWLRSHPDRIYALARGYRRLVPSVQPISVDTVFDVASLTKVMGTAALAATLVDRGWLRWDTPVAAFFPGYHSPAIHIGHLLAHTSGLPALFPYWERLRELHSGVPIESVPVRIRQRQARELTLSVRPEAALGERAVYSDVGYILAGFMLEELTGMPLDKAVRELVWDPMRLYGPHFRHVTSDPERGRDESVAATEDSEWRGGVLQGQVHDDNCWAMGGYAGHAGVFAPIRDVLFFARALVHGHFSPESTIRMWTRVTPPVGPEGCERTLGWDTPTVSPSGPASSAGRYFSPRSIGHLGFTGTALWIDPDVPMAGALLTNRVHPSRANDRIRQLRPAFFDALREDLAELGLV